jgi:hypothetical protein
VITASPDAAAQGDEVDTAVLRRSSRKVQSVLSHLPNANDEQRIQHRPEEIERVQLDRDQIRIAR